MQHKHIVVLVYCCYPGSHHPMAECSAGDFPAPKVFLKYATPIYACVYTHVRTHTHMYTYTHMHACTHTQHMDKLVLIHANYTFIHTYKQINMCRTINE